MGTAPDWLASEPEHDAAVRFLKRLDPEGTTHLLQTFTDSAKKSRPDQLAAVIPIRGHDLAPVLPRHERGAGVYVTVNECPGKRRLAECVTRIRAVWCEADRGLPDKWPIEPTLIVSTSPGRFHAYWLVAGEWPADGAGRADFAAVMERMVASHGSDKNAKDIVRVLRLPGFVNRKHGEPHMVKVVSDNGRRYTREEICKAFPPVAKPEERPTAPAPGNPDMERIRDALRHIPADDRDDWLKVGMALKSELGDAGRDLWDEWSAKSDKYDLGDQDRTWASFKREEGKKVTIATVYRLALDSGWTGEPPKAPADVEFKEEAKPNSNPPSLKSVRASDVEMRAIEWLWENRFALGKLGLIVGLPDEGKGQILSDMAARITRGAAWPFSKDTARQGKVILLTAEDDPADTVVPRLKAAGADLDCIEIVSMVREGKGERMFSLVTDLALLRQKIIETGNVRQVQIDPVSAYFGIGKVDSFRTTDVRAVLGPLCALAAEMAVSVVGIMHFNKKTDVTNAVLRISDSLAFGATARHVYAAVDDRENQRKLLVRGKNNLAPASVKALAYGFGAQDVGIDPRTAKIISAPHIKWLAEVDVSATDAMQAASDGKAPARGGAMKFLAEMLADGPVASTEIEEAAQAQGISRATLFRAKRTTGVIAKKDSFSGGWRWRLPRPTAEEEWPPRTPLEEEVARELPECLQ